MNNYKDLTIVSGENLLEEFIECTRKYLFESEDEYLYRIQVKDELLSRLCKLDVKIVTEAKTSFD